LLVLQPIDLLSKGKKISGREYFLKNIPGGITPGKKGGGGMVKKKSSPRLF
jgi:hypothetical protein